VCFNWVVLSPLPISDSAILGTEDESESEEELELLELSELIELSEQLDRFTVEESE
jgi:hypothetical protein